jgi:hypothetical protein
VQELLSNKFEFQKKQCELLRAHQEHLESIAGASGQ